MKKFYSEQLREIDERKLEAETIYQMAKVRLADAEKLYLKLAEFVDQKNPNEVLLTYLQNIEDKFNQFTKQQQEIYRQRLEDLEKNYLERSLLLEERLQSAIDLEKKSESRESSVVELSEMRKKLIQLTQWSDDLKNTIVSFHPKHSDDISPSAFEKYVGRIYILQGYKVEHIGGTGDQGVDLIAIDDQIRIAVQIKRYDLENRVGVTAVQEVFTGKAIHNCQEAAIVTTSAYTKAALEMAEQLQIRCIDGKAFKEIVQKLQMI